MHGHRTLKRVGTNMDIEQCPKPSIAIKQTGSRTALQQKKTKYHFFNFHFLYTAANIAAALPDRSSP